MCYSTLAYFGAFCVITVEINTISSLLIFVIFFLFFNESDYVHLILQPLALIVVSL